MKMNKHKETKYHELSTYRSRKKMAKVLGR